MSILAFRFSKELSTDGNLAALSPYEAQSTVHVLTTRQPSSPRLRPLPLLWPIPAHCEAVVSRGQLQCEAVLLSHPLPRLQPHQRRHQLPSFPHHSSPSRSTAFRCAELTPRTSRPRRRRELRRSGGWRERTPCCSRLQSYCSYQKEQKILHAHTRAQ